MLVTIGACATAGGIQALRNFGDVAEFASAVYASPAYIDTLATSTPISAHVPVDFELRGCPIDRWQLLEVLTALLVGRKPDVVARGLTVPKCWTLAQPDAEVDLPRSSRRTPGQRL